MSIQRIFYGVKIFRHEDNAKKFAVQMNVECEGIAIDREEALQVIVESWADAMEQSGLNPDIFYSKMRSQGKFQ